jgi:hypothetical protein
MNRTAAMQLIQDKKTSQDDDDDDFVCEHAVE